MDSRNRTESMRNNCGGALFRHVGDLSSHIDPPTSYSVLKGTSGCANNLLAKSLRNCAGYHDYSAMTDRGNAHVFMHCETILNRLMSFPDESPF